jgi:hypothetical protein
MDKISTQNQGMTRTGRLSNDRRHESSNSLEKTGSIVDNFDYFHSPQVLFREFSTVHEHFQGNWILRGKGDLMIIVNDLTSASRVYMIPKFTVSYCLNHRNSKDSKISKKAGNDRTIIWYAPDFTSGTFKSNVFAASFQKEAAAEKFIQCFQVQQSL